ncbi:MAG: GntR family transcriptional regulator [Propionibacteriaceae bacterium]|jgi:GntR family transcriptional regulator|nr:GntR family transcriptional regulator [Propionibacteriaceae bacterium]
MELTGGLLKHTQIRGYLRSLALHELNVGDTIPSERELCEQFQVARMTVRQAVDALVTEGILTRVQGKGTFVAGRKVDLQMHLTTFEQEMTNRGLHASSEVLAADLRQPPSDVAAALALEPQGRTYYLYRLRLANGEPMALEESWLPAGLLPHLFEPTTPLSLYSTLIDRGLSPDWGEDMVDADDASAAEAQLLGIAPGRAVLRIARRTFASKVAVVYSRSVYRGDRYTMWVPVMAPAPVRRRPSRQAPPLTA